MVVETILSGAKNGRDTWQATASIDATEQKDGASVETVLLRSQIELATHALNLTRSYVWKVTPSERIQSVKALQKAGYEITVPEIQGLLVEVTCKEIKFLEQSNVDAFLAVLSLEAEARQADKPTLGASNVDDVEKANILHRLLLNEKVIPQIAKGEAGAPLTLYLVTQMIVAYEHLLSQDLSTILRLAVADIISIAKCLRSLMTEDAPTNLEDVDRISNAKAGSKSYVAQACVCWCVVIKLTPCICGRSCPNHACQDLGY